MIAITFDTDHVDERRMAEFLERTHLPGEATFFCPEPYSALGATAHEQCGHPFLDHTVDWDAELQRSRELFPDAVGFRSHSCVYSHALALRLGQEGYLYASTQDVFGGRLAAPHREAWGLWQLPIYYMDTLDFSLPRFWPQIEHSPFDPSLIDAAFDEPGLFVFDFHPVHVLLNSPSAEWYLSRRDAFVAGAPLDTLRSPGPGAGDFLAQLSARMDEANVKSITLRDALREHAGAPSMPRGA